MAHLSVDPAKDRPEDEWRPKNLNCYGDDGDDGFGGGFGGGFGAGEGAQGTAGDGFGTGMSSGGIGGFSGGFGGLGGYDGYGSGLGDGQTGMGNTSGFSGPGAPGDTGAFAAEGMGWGFADAGPSGLGGVYGDPFGNTPGFGPRVLGDHFQSPRGAPMFNFDGNPGMSRQAWAQTQGNPATQATVPFGTTPTQWAGMKYDMMPAETRQGMPAMTWNDWAGMQGYPSSGPFVPTQPQLDSLPDPQSPQNSNDPNSPMGIIGGGR